MLYYTSFGKEWVLELQQKNIQDVYLDRAPALRTVKKWFGRFRKGDFNLDDQPRSDRPSDIDDDIVRAHFSSPVTSLSNHHFEICQPTF